jgi:glutamate synthase domain-containing protein 1
MFTLKRKGLMRSNVEFIVPRRVDFRCLISEVFAIYKTRIWMQQVEARYQQNQGPPFKSSHIILLRWDHPRPSTIS